MKPARSICILTLVFMSATASGVRADTFFDFGLRWTQWIPNHGKVQKFEKEDVPTIIAVPKPAGAVGYEIGTLNDPGQSPGSRPFNSTYSTTTTYDSAPAASNRKGTAPPPATSIPSYSQPPAQPISNSFFVSTPPSASFNTAATSDISSQDRFDALIRMDSGPYPMAEKLLTGQPQAWYASPVVQNLYGGVPTDVQKRAFENDVLTKVEQTYVASGIGLNLTNDPTAAAARTISVVSGAGYGANNDVAGITVMNSDGFSFIDKLSHASSVDELEWAVARNVAHELLHAFNVGHFDTTGNYLDAAVAKWDLLTAADTRFSDLAIEDLRTKIASGVPDSTNSGFANFGQHLESGSVCAHCIAAQTLDVRPVPEPTTVVIWFIGAGLLYRNHRNRRARKV